MRLRRWMAGILCGFAPAAWSADGPLDEVASVRSFMLEVESRHGLDGAWLEEIFRDARRQQSILDAFARPAEAKPWHAYREIFVTPKRVRGGAKFVAKHRPLLERVRERFGVPPEIVAAIIGVETFYGRYTGRYRVIDALSTLAFFSPRRGKFFRRELEEYLLFLQEENRGAADLMGSYAGAIGIPQFIPSSYRAYAVDFDGDGRRDLSGSVDDAVGSVGSYLGRHGWRAGDPVAVPVTALEPARADPLAGELRPELAWRDLEAVGVRIGDDVPSPAPETPVALVRLDGAEGPEYWAGFRNFYVITRYNRSALYAMAVHQLAVEIGRGVNR
jgi:membrane-bound lytic murein transglycosylase B